MDFVNVREIFRHTAQYENKEVCIGGWVRSNRSSKSFGFIVVNDGTFLNDGGRGKFTIQNSNITTEYKTYKWDNPNNSFIFSNVGIGIITNCNFNISCTALIRVNYNEIYFNNNNITFNQSYIGNNVGYTLGGTEVLNNKFYKNFDTPTVQLFVTGTNYINDVEFSDTVIV